jgi:hypothetical protein
MKGLILAGIGKGIADAGQTVSNFMVKDIEDKRKEMLDALREERQAAREMARDERLSEREAERETRKIEREAATAEALKQRLARESVQIEGRAAEAPIRRDAAALGRDAQTLAKSSAQAGEDGDIALSEDQLKGLMQNDPQMRESYAKSGIIGGAIQDKMDPRLRAAEDQATAALEIGAHSSVIDAYSKKRRDVLEQIRLENTATRSEQQHIAQMAAITERGRQFDERRPILQQVADARTTSAGAAVTRANRPPSSGKSSTMSGMSEVKLNQEAETLRKAAKDASSMDARRDYEARLKEVMDEIQARRKSGGTTTPKTGDNSGAKKVGKSPHPEGTRLKGPDGIYVVRNGQPVLEK